MSSCNHITGLMIVTTYSLGGPFRPSYKILRQLVSHQSRLEPIFDCDYETTCLCSPEGTARGAVLGGFVVGNRWVSVRSHDCYDL